MAKNPDSTTHNFRVLGDGKLLWQSGPMNYRDPAKQVELEVKGIKTLILIVTNVGSHPSHVQLDWADARFIVAGRAPQTTTPPAETATLLTPKPGAEPRINGPKVYGCGPNHPFLYRIPATGNRPMQFSAENLPAGLTLDRALRHHHRIHRPARGLFRHPSGEKRTRQRDPRI